MAANPSVDLKLTALNGKSYPLSAYLVQYQLLAVALDPFTNQSSWILKTAARILETFDQADCRVCFVLAGANADEAKEYLGPLADRILTFPDPDRAIVRSLGLGTVPAIVHIANDASVVNAFEGWDAAGWEDVTNELARVMHWTGPVLPAPGDPGPFAGTPALG